MCIFKLVSFCLIFFFQSFIALPGYLSEKCLNYCKNLLHIFFFMILDSKKICTHLNKVGDRYYKPANKSSCGTFVGAFYNCELLKVILPMP